MPTAGWWETLWPKPARVLEAVGLKRNMDAVDLCCGDGWFTSEMAKIARRVLAIDIDRNMLDVARDRLIKAGTTNFELVEGDAYELTTLAGRLVDFVLMANAFHGVPNQLRLAQSTFGSCSNVCSTTVLSPSNEILPVCSSIVIEPGLISFK